MRVKRLELFGFKSFAVKTTVHFEPGVTANAIMAGVTDTPALRKIPGNEQMMARVIDKHPQKRLTTPPDVARFIAALTSAGTAWLSGNTLRVDGGEEIAG